MKWRSIPFLVFLTALISTGVGQELTISTTAKTYNSGEEVWVNLSILKATSIPGAYKIKLSFDGAKLQFKKILPANSGPFSVTPSASAASGVVTIAGFQGISDTGSGNVSLVTMVFSPSGATAVVDTSTFFVASDEIYTAQAQMMNMTIVKHPTSVLLPPLREKLKQNLRLTKNYLQFTAFNKGLTSVQIFDMGGRVCSVPLKPIELFPGRQAVPLGKPLSSGMYVVAIRNAGYNATQKLEVLR